MTAEVRHLIDNEKFYLGSVRAVADLLPESDADLDNWLAQSITSHDQMAFHFLLYAALLKERCVDSHHLRGGFCMLAQPDTAICLIWKMQGDVAADLIHAVQNTLISRPMHALALLTAQAWCVEYCNGVLPSELVTEARLLAHAGKPDPLKLSYLWGLSARLHDPRLETVLIDCTPADQLATHQSNGIKLAETTLALVKLPIDAILDEVCDRRISTSGPLRRAVERTGRNDPCHCGSGKKYKRCCEDKDKERLRHSSSVPGMTKAEVRARPDEQLTPARLEKMYQHDLARINPALIKGDLREPYIHRLAASYLLPEVCTAFEILRCDDPDMVALWHDACFFIAQKHRLDCARRMVAVLLQHGPVVDEFDSSLCLLLCSDDPPRYLDMLEHLSRAALQVEVAYIAERLACGLLSSPWKSLGILIARSFIPIAPKRLGTLLLEQIQIARDHLDLPPEEPFAEVLEKRLHDTSRETGAEAAALQKSRRLLADKAAEIRTRTEKLAQIQRDIRLHEKQLAATTASTPKADAENETLRALREKLAATNASLRASNEERTALRRQAMEAVSQAEAARAKQPTPAATSEAEDDPEDDPALTHPGGIDSHHLPRPIDFPRRFHDTLQHLPTQVGRAALILIGRIAAGESAAFTGIVRLRATPDVLRARIGRDHRLLFRLHPDRIEVVALINRRDLDRRIEKL